MKNYWRTGRLIHIIHEKDNKDNIKVIIEKRKLMKIKQTIIMGRQRKY